MPADRARLISDNGPRVLAAAESLISVVVGLVEPLVGDLGIDAVVVAPFAHLLLHDDRQAVLEEIPQLAGLGRIRVLDDLDLNAGCGEGTRSAFGSDTREELDEGADRLDET